MDCDHIMHAALLKFFVCAIAKLGKGIKGKNIVRHLLFTQTVIFIQRYKKDGKPLIVLFI